MKIYVNVNAGHDGNGTEQMPFRHINDAAKIAQPGDEVWVAPGVYREYVDPVHAGREDARITYRSVEPLGAVITGAERIQSWVPYKENVWVCRVANSLFGNYNPYTTMVYGDWYFAKADKHTGCVYLNNRALYEAGSVEECIKAEVYECSWVPEESTYKWYTEQDQEKDETVIYANFHGADPNEENVEINVRRECFMPSKTGVGYITVSGFVVTKAATTWAPPAAYQDGMIGLTGVKDGSLRTAKFLTANVQEFLLENIMIRKMIIILLINMLRVQLKWKETRYAVDSIMAGLRKK